MFAEHKIVIVGLDNAGKTTILYQFLMNEVVTTSPTIGSNVEEVVWKNIHFIMWDLGGQQSLRAAWSTYYSNTEVCIIMFVPVKLNNIFLSIFIFNCNFLTMLIVRSCYGVIYKRCLKLLTTAFRILYKVYKTFLVLLFVHKTENDASLLIMK